MALSQTLQSAPVTVFHDRRLPEPAEPAGYAALIHAHARETPLPHRLCAIGSRHKLYEQDGWRLFTPRHRPDATLAGHLTFALKNEGIDLLVLKRLFTALGPNPIRAVIEATPTGGYARRTWFLYEWLTGDRLNLPDADKGPYVPVVDPKRQWTVQGRNSPRHRVRDNLPGTPAFCPMTAKTPAIQAFVSRDLPNRARAAVAAVPKDVLLRTAAFLLLKDSRSSYAIEGERPPQDRIQRWGRVIGEAGRQTLDADELLRLQRIVIGDARFVHLGWRREGGFVGEHDRDTQAPLPDHISARHEDIEDLIGGLLAFDANVSSRLDPVVAAAVLAFGFVYIHPFEDGNGRIHRYLIHHALARSGFNPPELVFPVSAAILDRIDDYRRVLESHSARILPAVDWQATPRGNVEVRNETADLYRYFDATPHAEFLYECVARTIDTDLPEETAFLRRYDAFRTGIEAMIDMPAGTIDLLFRFLRQNGGTLSKRAREGEFAALNDAEVARIETIFTETQADVR